MVLTLDEWEQQWQQNWSKVGSASYELPAGGTGGEEREFLNHTRAPAKEVELLERIQAEFVKGFKALCKLGPAVTVSGSARFNQNHKNYQLARAVGGELAPAGLVVLTVGGPGIMGAANPGAHKAGGTTFLQFGGRENHPPF